MIHALLVLAAEEAEKSETPFFVAGVVFAVWAVFIGVTACARSPSRPAPRRAARSPPCRSCSPRSAWRSPSTSLPDGAHALRRAGDRRLHRACAAHVGCVQRAPARGAAADEHADAGRRRTARPEQARDSLSVTDNRTGQTYELPITDGTIRGVDLRQIKTDDEDFGLMSYDPAFMNTASCRSAVTYIDGDKGILEYRGYPIEQLAEQATYLEVAYLLVYGELPTQPQLDAWIERDHDPHVRARERQGLHAGLPLRRAPDGDAARRGRRAVDLLPGRQGHPGRAEPPHPDDPPDREDADARRVLLPPLARPAVRLSRQRPVLLGQLPRDALQDDRAEVPARSAAGARARHPLHPARRPRAELLDERGALRRLLAASIRTRRSPPASPRSTGRCTAAPTRRCCGCCAGSRRRRTSRRSSRA